MGYWIFTIVVVLHAMVFAFYLAMGLGWMAIPDSDYDFTVKNWWLSGALGEQTARRLGVLFFDAVVLLFLVAVVGLFFRQSWSIAWLYAAIGVSTLSLLAMWDGRFDKLVEKGLLGLLTNAGLLVVMLVFNYPAF